MLARRLTALLVLLPALLVLSGCATLQPSHVTIYADRTESQTDGDRRGRTVANKVGVSATYDLPPR